MELEEVEDMENMSECPTEILEYALTLERDGYDFYCEASKKVANPIGKQMLEWLAREETEHIKKLSRALHSLKAEGKLVCSEEDLAGHDAVRFKTFFSQATEKVKSMIPAEADDLRALETAMDMENRGYAFYTKSKEEMTSSEGRALLESLARDESAHYDALQNTYTYLKTPDLWYAWEEGHMYEGG